MSIHIYIYIYTYEYTLCMSVHNCTKLYIHVWFAHECTQVHTSVHECTRVNMSVHECTPVNIVYTSVHKCARVYTDHTDEAGDVEPDGVADELRVFHFRHNGVVTHVSTRTVDIVVHRQTQVVDDTADIVTRCPLLVILVKVHASVNSDR